MRAGTGKEREMARGKCVGCEYRKHCGGFRGKEGRCPEWVVNDRKGEREDDKGQVEQSKEMLQL